jgi:hypothetical protein
LVHPLTAQEVEDVNVTLGGLIEEAHYCPGCGTVESRLAE